ncbi:unnamed protein product [Effrenium voratum]|nr:unnamed protein product [Effrenium voratum]
MVMSVFWQTAELSRFRLCHPGQRFTAREHCKVHVQMYRQAEVIAGRRLAHFQSPPDFRLPTGAQKERPSQSESPRSLVWKFSSGEAPEMAAGLLPVEPAKAPELPVNGFQSAGLHGCAGLLTAPRQGPGLALTLSAQPGLDSSHRVLGPVLSGRRCFRRLEALVPLSHEAHPRVPIFFQLPKLEEEAKPQLRLEPYKDSAAQPFAEDPEEAALPPEELLDLADVELNGRDVEVADLKQSTFSRERQQGVDKVEEALTKLLQRLEGLENLDETLSGASHKMKQRGRRQPNLRLALMKRPLDSSTEHTDDS